MWKPRSSLQRKRNRKIGAVLTDCWNSKCEVKIASRRTPDNLTFPGLPKNVNGYYLRLKYLKPLAQHIQVTRSDNFGLDEIIFNSVKSQLDAVYNRFDEEIENFLQQVHSDYVSETRKLLTEENIQNFASLE